MSSDSPYAFGYLNSRQRRKAEAERFNEARRHREADAAATAKHAATPKTEQPGKSHGVIEYVQPRSRALYGSRGSAMVMAATLAALAGSR